MTPVPNDTEHMDVVSVKTRDIATRMQPYLKTGVSVALVIDWLTQARSLELYRTRSNGQLLRHIIKVGALDDVEEAFQCVLSEAVQFHYANQDARR